MRERNTNLSAHPTRFIGRDSDLARLRDAFARGERLVTVLGPGGMGKTRLGLRYAQVHLEEVAPAGGVWIGDVSTAHDVDGICGAVGRPLGVALTTGPRSSDAVDQLGHALSVRGRTLMVIDNFEHVAAHAAATLGRWLERAPEAAFQIGRAHV